MRTSGDAEGRDPRDSRSGPPALLFVPAVGGHAAEFAAQVAHFAYRHRVSALDPSPAADGTDAAQASGPTPAEQAAWIGARAEELGLLPCVLVGHAGGGLAALELAVRQPWAVLGVVLLDLPMPPGPVVGRIARRVAALPWLATSFQRRARISELGYDSLAALRAVTRPVLVVGSRPVPLRLPQGIRTAVVSADDRSATGGDGAHERAPVRVNRLVEEFLAGLA